MDKNKILEELGGIPEEVYDSIVKSFHEESKTRLYSLKTAISSSNWADVVKLAHAIKGSAGNLRITDIQEIARNLEHAAKEGNSENINKYMSELEPLIQ